MAWASENGRIAAPGGLAPVVNEGSFFDAWPIRQPHRTLPCKPSPRLPSRNSNRSKAVKSEVSNNEATDTCWGAAIAASPNAQWRIPRATPTSGPSPIGNISRAPACGGGGDRRRQVGLPKFREYGGILTRPGIRLSLLDDRSAEQDTTGYRGRSELGKAGYTLVGLLVMDDQTCRSAAGVPKATAGTDFAAGSMIGDCELRPDVLCFTTSPNSTSEVILAQSGQSRSLPKRIA